MVRNFIVTLAIAGCASANQSGARQTDNCNAPESVAVPFGPLVTPADSGRLHSSVMTSEGREFYYFSRVGPGDEDYRIFKSVRSGDSWTMAQPVDLGGNHSDLYPSLSPDGTRLVFSSYRPAPGDTARVANAHLWMSVRSGDGWSTPEFVSASRLGHYHSGLAQDSAGNLSFAVTTPDWRRTTSARLSWLGNRYESTIADVPLHPAVAYWRGALGDTVHVWGAFEGLELLTLLSVSKVTQRQPRRLAPAVFYITSRSADTWTPLRPAGGGLGEGAPNFLWSSPDGCYIHYTRNYSQFMRVPVRVVTRVPAQ
jgi:hypothetical protein